MVYDEAFTTQLMILFNYQALRKSKSDLINFWKALTILCNKRREVIILV